MGSERGFVSVRGLVLFGLVVAAVWVVPLMLATLLIGVIGVLLPGCARPG